MILKIAIIYRINKTFSQYYLKIYFLYLSWLLIFLGTDLAYIPFYLLQVHLSKLDFEIWILNIKIIHKFILHKYKLK